MAVLNNTGILAGSSAVTETADDYQITRSLKFNNDDDAHLKRAVRESNRKVWTWAGWVKRGNFGGGIDLFTHWADDNNYESLRFQVDDVQWWAYVDSGNVENGGGATGVKCRDPAAWMHICIVKRNATNNPSSDRQRVFINGKDVGLSAVFSSGAPGMINKEGTHRIGTYRGTDQHFGGYMADINFLDGSDIGPACFGKFDSTGVWVPTALNFPAINNGTTWSGSGFSGDAIDSSYPATHLFDGLVGNNQTYATQFQSSADAATIHWAPSTGIKYNQGIRVHLKYNGTCSINDGEHAVDTDGSGALHWKTIVNGSGTLNKITFNCTDSNEPVMLEGIEIDGQLLIDGKTDCTWDEWKALNDSPDLWSSYVTGPSYSSDTGLKTIMFDGAWRNGTSFPSEGNTMQFKPPTTITASSQIRVYMFINGSADTHTDNFVVNGTSQFNAALSAIGGGNTNWYTLSGTTIDSTNGLQWKRTSGTSQVQMCAIEVDGVLLTDSINSYSLKFDNTTSDGALGLDTLHTKIENCTGGLPIYNTSDDYGLSKGSGHRTDSNASSLVLAVPGDAIADVSHSSDLRNSGSALTLTNNGSVTTTVAHRHFYSKSLSFNGSDQWLDIPSISTNNNNKYCIELWAKHKQDAEQQIIEFKSSDSSGDYLYIQQNNNEGYRFRGGGLDQSTAGSFARDGDWVHVAYTNDGSKARAFVNGTLVGEADSSSWTIQGTLIGAIGAGADSGHSQKFNGYVQDVRVYFGIAKYTSDFTVPYRNDWEPINLTAGDGQVTVANADGALPIYNTSGDDGGTKESGKRADSFAGSTDATGLVYALPGDAIDGDCHNDINSGSTRKDTNTAGTAPTVVTDNSRFYGSAIRFGGSGTLKTSDSPGDYYFGTGPWTIEFWVRSLNDPGAELGFFHISGDSGDSPGAEGIAIRQYGGKFNYRMYDNSTTMDFSAGHISAEGLVKKEEWAHIALVHEGSNTYKFFVNGYLCHTSTGGTQLSWDSGNSGCIILGGYWDNDYRSECDMQDVRVYHNVAKYTARFTPPRLSRPQNNDSLIDTPTNYGDDTGVGGEVRGNYCTWNPFDRIDTTNVLLTEGHLTIQTPGHTTSATAYGTTRGTMGVTSGKWYWEIDNYTQYGSTGTMITGVISTDVSLPQQAGDVGCMAYNASDGKKWIDNVNTSYGDSYTTGDVIGVALDMDNGAIYFSKNNTWQASGVPTSGSSRTNAANTWTAGTKSLTPGISDLQEGSGRYIKASLNAGQRAFKYTAPSGFKCLCTQNLPDLFSGDALNDPSKYFDTLLWTGNSQDDREIKGLKFGPDLIWNKIRNEDGGARMIDILRGSDERLLTHQDVAQTDNDNEIQEFRDNGFQICDRDEINDSGNTYVAWCWDAGTSTVSNTDGDITASVRASPDSGFSIIKFTSNATDNQTIGHGLNAAPSLIIIKNIDATEDWWVIHEGCHATDPWNDRALFLNSTAAITGSWGTVNNVAPTNTVVNISNSTNTAPNDDTNDKIMYCFAPIPGFSAFGGYQGKGGKPFVHLGFRPKFLMIRATTTGRNWILIDGKRFPHNGDMDALYANSNVAEQNHNAVDILSNGFKIVDDGYSDYNVDDQITYAAWAEHPFKTARAR